jgi:hypothetical protein
MIGRLAAVSGWHCSDAVVSLIICIQSQRRETYRFSQPVGTLALVHRTPWRTRRVYGIVPTCSDQLSRTSVTIIVHAEILAVIAIIAPNVIPVDGK